MKMIVLHAPVPGRGPRRQGDDGIQLGGGRDRLLRDAAAGFVRGLRSRVRIEKNKFIDMIALGLQLFA